MFGLGVPELLFIMLLALLIFGPKRLPQIGRTLGRGMAEFRKASTELHRSLNTELDLDERPSSTPRPTPAQVTAGGAEPSPPAAEPAGPPPDTMARSGDGAVVAVGEGEERAAEEEAPDTPSDEAEAAAPVDSGRSNP